MARESIIFISCGQRTEEERDLGQKICRLVDELTLFKPYFADFQQSLDGLTEHILKALDAAVGFIAVMHCRGRVVYFPNKHKVSTISELMNKASLEGLINGEHDRGSVWIEQETAIAAYMRQVLGKPLEVLAYVQDGIELEGLRKYVFLNPVIFKSSSEILEDLEKKLPEWSKTLYSEPQSALDMKLYYETELKSQDRHEHLMKAEIINTGELTATDYRLDLEIPSPIIDPHDRKRNIVPERSNKHTTLLRFIAGKDFPEKLHQGDPTEVNLVKYIMDLELFDRKQLLDNPVRAILYSNDRPVKTIERPLREFQEF